MVQVRVVFGDQVCRDCGQRGDERLLSDLCHEKKVEIMMTMMMIMMTMMTRMTRMTRMTMTMMMVTMMMMTMMLTMMRKVETERKVLNFNCGKKSICSSCGEAWSRLVA